MSDLPKSAKCPRCGVETTFDLYVFAHWNIELTRTCECGCEIGLQRGIAYELPGQRKKSRGRKTDGTRKNRR